MDSGIEVLTPIRKKPGPASKTLYLHMNGKKTSPVKTPNSSRTVEPSSSATITTIEPEVVYLCSTAYKPVPQPSSSEAALHPPDSEPALHPPASEPSFPPPSSQTPLQAPASEPALPPSALGKPMQALKVRNPFFSPLDVSNSEADGAPAERNIFGKNRTSCLLCSDPVLLGFSCKCEDNEGTGEAEVNPSSSVQIRRLKAVQDLCRYFKFNPKEIPDSYSEEKFPFCFSCQKFVDRISASYKVIREEELKISESARLIERKVADAELLRTPGPTTPSTDDKRFLKLREVVLNGYRQKLLLKKKLRESLLMTNNSGDIDPSLVSQNMREGQYNDVNGNARSGQEESEGTTGMMNTNTNLNLEIMAFDSVDQDHDLAFSPESEQSVDVDVSISEDTHLSGFQSVIPQENYSQISNEDEFHSHPDAIMDSQNGSSFMNGVAAIEISDVRSVGMELTLASIKQEEPSSDEEDNNNVSVSEIANKVLIPAPVQIKKKRSISQGIQIYRLTNSLSDNRGQKSLQCGACEYTVQICVGDHENVADRTIRAHIKDVHLKKPASQWSTDSDASTGGTWSSPRSIAASKKPSTSLKRKRDVVCGICSERFEDFKTLMQHRKASDHYVVHQTPPKNNADGSSSDEAEMCECDICGRTVRYAYYLSHRYTHKNPEEKMQAIVSREIGAPAKSSKEFKTLQKYLRERDRPKLKVQEKKRQIKRLRTA